MAEGILAGLAGRPAGIARRITIRRSTAATQPPEPGRFDSVDAFRPGRYASSLNARYGDAIRLVTFAQPARAQTRTAGDN